MRLPRYLVLVWCLSASVFAQTLVMKQGFIPDRPALLRAHWRNQPYPVVSFKDGRPIVLADGKKRMADSDPRLGLGIADSYAPGYVTVENTEAQSWTMEQYLDGNLLSGRPSWTKFSAHLSADRNLNDVFILLVVFERGAAHTDEPPKVAMLGVPVGALKEGVKRRVSAVLPALNTKLEIGWAALVFSDEGQVRSSGPEKIVSQFFDRLERYSLQRRINERIVAGQDAPLQILRHLPIQVEDELRERYAGRTVEVRLRVGIDGAVETVEMVNRDERDLQRALQSQLRHWLFVPPMKDGLIVRQQVVLPLEL